MKKIICGLILCLLSPSIFAGGSGLAHLPLPLLYAVILVPLILFIGLMVFIYKIITFKNNEDKSIPKGFSEIEYLMNGFGYKFTGSKEFNNGLALFFAKRKESQFIEVFKNKESLWTAKINGNRLQGDEAISFDHIKTLLSHHLLKS